MLHGVLVWESATKTALTPGKDLSSPNEYSAEFGSFQEQHTYTQRTNTTNNNNESTYWLTQKTKAVHSYGQRYEYKGFKDQHKNRQTEDKKR